MDLKDRLSLYSVLIFSVVIFMASAAIYISFYKWMQHNEIQVLESKTLLAAIYYLEADEESYSQRETTKDRLRRSISRKTLLFSMKKVFRQKARWSPMETLHRH